MKIAEWLKEILGSEAVGVTVMGKGEEAFLTVDTNKIEGLPHRNARILADCLEDALLNGVFEMDREGYYIAFYPVSGFVMIPQTLVEWAEREPPRKLPGAHEMRECIRKLEAQRLESLKRGQ